MNLHTPLTNVRGVGPKTGQTLSAAGLATVEDILNFYPRTYEDYENVENVADVKPGKVVIRARVEKINNRYARRNMIITTATLVDNNGDKVQATWFNQPYLKGKFSIGNKYKFFGKATKKAGKVMFTSPVFDMEEKSQNTGRIVPIYPLTYNLSQNNLRKIIEAGIEQVYGKLLETLPEYILKEYKLQNINDAIKQIFTIAGITRNVEVRNALTGEMEIRPINELASSHIARRTFVGIAYKQVADPNIIGKMSGHVEGSKAFVRYRDIDDDMLKDVINKIG